MDDAKTPSSKRNEVARSKEKQARLDRLCKREPYPILLCPDPQPPWKTIEEIRNASKSVLDALSARVRSQHEVKYTLLIALDLWEATRSFSIPQNCPDIRTIRKYQNVVDLPEDAIGHVEGVLEAILSWAEAEGEAQAEEGQTGAGGLAKHNKDVAHSVDFRSLKWFGETYYFSASQAPAVEMLYKHWKQGTPDVGSEALLLAIDHASPPKRLSDVFRSSPDQSRPAWGEIIVPGETRASYRLSPPEKK